MHGSKMVLGDKKREADEEAGFTHSDMPGQTFDRRGQCFIEFIE